MARRGQQQTSRDFGFRWENSAPSVRFDAFRIHLRKELYVIIEVEAQKIEAYMKDNAPWEDRTGDARDGLTATTEHRVLIHSIILSHGVDYGYWLEVIKAGKYAIIGPTMHEIGTTFMTDIGQVFEGRFTGR